MCKSGRVLADGAVNAVKHKHSDGGDILIVHSQQGRRVRVKVVIGDMPMNILDSGAEKSLLLLQIVEQSSYLKGISQKF